MFDCCFNKWELWLRAVVLVFRPPYGIGRGGIHVCCAESDKHRVHLASTPRGRGLPDSIISIFIGLSVLAAFTMTVMAMKKRLVLNRPLPRQPPRHRLKNQRPPTKSRRLLQGYYLLCFFLLLNNPIRILFSFFYLSKLKKKKKNWTCFEFLSLNFSWTSSIWSCWNIISNTVLLR